jgi:hypothetical protein
MSGKGVLQEHMIFQKTRTLSLSDVRALNMWGYELENVAIISQLSNVETLSLPVNKISTLAPFESCKRLQQLLLRDNQISSFDELRHLQDLPCLTTLSLINNPIAQRPNYRETVIRRLPRLKKLDDIAVEVKLDEDPVQEVISRKRSEPDQKAIPQMETSTRRGGDDANMLAAVLSLIPELSPDSLRAVLDAIGRRCR